MAYRFYTEVAPGCHASVRAPIISRHRTWHAAMNAARKSDRLVAVDTETGKRFSIAQQNHPNLGAGRYGCGA